MAASISTASATSPNAPSAKRKRKRSSTNLKKPRRRNPKRKNRKKRSRKKNPNRPRQAASTRRPFCPEVRCEDHIHLSPYCPDLHRGQRLGWSGIREIGRAHV